MDQTRGAQPRRLTPALQNLRRPDEVPIKGPAVRVRELVGANFLQETPDAIHISDVPGRPTSAKEEHRARPPSQKAARLTGCPARCWSRRFLHGSAPVPP